MEQNILEITPKAWGSPRSKLAEIILSGHLDKDGAARFNLQNSERRRLLAWIDSNVPYYGTSETTHPETPGCRRVYPKDLDTLLADVSKRRCAHRHQAGRIPRQFWTRIGKPQLNSFLTAPLSVAAGGSGACGKPVFESPADSDYQAILSVFAPVLADLSTRPRTDMPGAKAADVDRSCLGSLY